MKKIITLLISLLWIVCANAQVQQVEYFFDTDPGYGKATIAGTPITNNGESVLDFSASVTNLSDGLHTLYIRAKNAKGWSQTMQRSFVKATLLGDAVLNLKNLEYFIDTDPGYENGIPVDIASGNGVHQLDINVNTLSSGLHTLYVRGQNQNGQWSQVMHKSFIKMLLPSDKLHATYMEYFIDTDPGVNKGIPIDVSSESGIHNFSVATHDLTEGPHILYVRAYFPNNTWSQVMHHAFAINNPSKKLKSLEYFVDTDPGYGLGTNIALNSEQEVFDFDVNINSLTDGLHTLYIRALNQSGLWSQTLNRSFIKTTLTGETSQNLTYLEYFVDTDPGYGLGTAMAVTPGNETYEIDININSLTDGLHILYVRAKNQNGNWSQVMKYAFVKTGLAPTNLQSVEYYIDNDPGAGNGIQVSYSTGSKTLDFTANISGISNGEHILYIRGKYDNNQWGNIGSHTFSINNTVNVTGISLNKHSLSLNVTQTETLTAAVIPQDASNKTVNWTSSNNTIATVNNGIITALTVGSTYITATTQDGGFKDSCLVSVTSSVVNVTGISLNTHVTTIQSGKTETLVATVIPLNATNKTVNWTSSNNTIATVNNGIVTAITAGSVYIMATTQEGGFKDSCLITVILITSQSQYVEYFFDTDPGYGKATVAEILQEGSIEATVDFTASITNLTDGLHTLYVRAKSNKGWSQTIHYSFVKTSLSLEEGNQIAYLEYFIDTDPGYGAGNSIALASVTDGTYSFNTNIESLKEGLHILYVRALDKKGCWSQVMKHSFVKTILPPADLEYVEYYISSDPGKGNGTEVSFSKGSKTIDFTADLHTLSNGDYTLYIRGRTENQVWESIGQYPFRIINVSGISFSTHDMELKVNEKATISYTIYPTDAANKGINWQSRNTTKATVSNTGEVTALSQGTAYIVATTVDGSYQDSCTVTVIAIDAIDPLTGSKILLSIYPNPVTHGKLTIACEGWQNIQQKQIELYTMTGILMNHYKLTGSKTEIDISHLSSGTYVIRIGNEMVKIIKQ